MRLSMQELRRRREKAQWRSQFYHNSARTCRLCRHFDGRTTHRMCGKWEFLTQAGATCRQFSKLKEQLKEKS